MFPTFGTRGKTKNLTGKHERNENTKKAFESPGPDIISQ
jgi:hypothetical protein